MTSVLIYTKQTCPFCYRAKDLLDAKGVVFQEVKIDYSPALRQEMIELCGGYTVPQILIDEKPIGGCDELYALDYKGKLNEMLNIQPENL